MNLSSTPQESHLDKFKQLMSEMGLQLKETKVASDIALEIVEDFPPNDTSAAFIFDKDGNLTRYETWRNID